MQITEPKIASYSYMRALPTAQHYLCGKHGSGFFFIAVVSLSLFLNIICKDINLKENTFWLVVIYLPYDAQWCHNWFCSHWLKATLSLKLSAEPRDNIFIMTFNKHGRSDFIHLYIWLMIFFFRTKINERLLCRLNCCITGRFSCNTYLQYRTDSLQR